MQGTTENYIHLEKVSKIYGTKEVKIIAVDEISFNIAKGEFDRRAQWCWQDYGSEYSGRNGYCHQRSDLGRWKEYSEIQ